MPHPTGYPTYQILLRIVTGVHTGEPARAGAWSSALCAAGAVALVTDLARRTVSTRANASPRLAAVAALIAGSAWAVSPLLWGQAVIVEVYTLHALFCVALLWLLWRWAEVIRGGGEGSRWLTLGGLMFGLGLGNHLTLALILPGALYWIWINGRGKAGLRRGLFLASLATIAGLLVYAYLPFAASRQPPINWGNPVTIDGFLWVVTGRLYAPLPFGLPLAQLPARLTGWVTLTLTQFMPWGFAVALVGLWQLDRRSRDGWAATLLVFGAFTIYAIGYNSPDSDAYLLPAHAVMALWLAEGAAALLERVRRPVWLAASAAVMFLLATIAAPAFVRSWQDVDLSSRWEADAFWRTALAQAEPDAVILTAGDARTFALWYAVYGLKERPDVAVVNVNLYGFEWYRRALAETHPHLLPSVRAAPLEDLIAGWAAQWPVYTAEEIGLQLEGFEATRAGALIKLNP